MIGVLKEDIEETPLRNCGKEKQELQEISKSLEESQKKLPHKQMKETVQYLKMDIEAMKKTQIERILLEMKKNMAKGMGTADVNIKNRIQDMASRILSV